MNNAPLNLSSHKHTYPCKFLCDVDLLYDNKISVSNVSERRSYIKRLEGSKEYDVIFRKHKYRLLWFVVSKNVHESINKYLGELTLVHENIEKKIDRLIISIPLKVVDNEEFSYSLSQSIFKRLRNKIENNVPLNTSWDLRGIIPEKRSFYLYKGGYPLQTNNEDIYSYKNIVMQHAVLIRYDDLNYFLSLRNNKFSENNDSPNNDFPRPEIINNSIPIFYNDGELRNNLDYKKKDVFTRRNSTSYSGFKEITTDSLVAPHIHDDEPKEFYENIEDQIFNFFVSIFGLFLVIFFFKGHQLYPNNSLLKMGVKCVGLFIWIIGHFAYVYFGRFIASLTYFLISIPFCVCKMIMNFVNYFIRQLSSSEDLKDPYFKTEISGKMCNLFMNSIKNGLYSDINTQDRANRVFKFIAFCYAISSLFGYFIGIFGFPVSMGKNANPVTFIHGDMLCKNPIRKFGNLSGDECYGGIKVSDYLSDPKRSDIFMKEYERLKKTGLSSYNAMIESIKFLDPKNFSIDLNTEIDGNKFNFCDMYNETFGKEFDNKCKKKTVNTSKNNEEDTSEDTEEDMKIMTE